MPQKSQMITAAGNAENLLAYAYGTLEQLNWTIKYAGNNMLIAYTPKKLTKWDDEITVETGDNQLTITSKLVHGESFDMMGKNKKHIAEFLSAFDTTRKNSGEENLTDWKEKISLLKNDTIKVAEEEGKKAAEADKIMNFSKGGTQVTYGIIIINAIIFLLMVVSGIDFFSPAPVRVLKWGGNLPGLTFGGEWWRLISSVFLHFGIIHLAMNMYALFFVGVYLEPMLGKLRFIAAYLCSGIVASLVSVLWHKNDVIVSAGASGAIFGMFGVFLALLTTNIIPKQLKNSLLQSVLIFVGYNVFYGFKPNSGVDNAAHLGGLISGMVIGYVFYFTFKQPSEKKTQTATSLLSLTTVMLVFLVLRSEKMEPIEVDYKTGAIRSKVDKKQQDNAEKFSKTIEHFGILEELAIEAMQLPDSVSKQENLSRLKKIALVNWKECVNLMEDTKGMDLSERIKTLRTDLIQYANLRIKYTSLLIKTKEEETEKYNTEIESINQEVEKIIKKMNEDGGSEESN
ncbi:MAG: rhomboid family intramembrane serine protease [Chitinophagaceae bacterium]